MESYTRLAAIYNLWDSIELFSGSVNCLKNDVDLFVIVYQTESNWGEKYDPLPEITAVEGLFPGKKFVYERYQPLIFTGTANEKNKRNAGLDLAREYGCTHFLFLDADEYYTDFAQAKQLYLDSDSDGSVCKMYTYFCLPTLRFEFPDNYFVPFIHVLRSDSRAGTSDYPFYVDPTRTCNAAGVVELPVFMHHFSYIRKDIGRKLRNSSAKANIAASTVWADYTNAVPGYHVKPFFDQKLIEVLNIFNIEI